MGDAGETTYPEFSRKLNLGLLARELTRLHRYEQALEVLRTLFLKHQLSTDQVKCYSLFLTEYFAEQRETTDQAFTSRNQIAKLLRKRCAEYRDRTGKILLGTHNKDILGLIKSLEAKNLIKRQPATVEEKLYPSIFTFKRKYNKTHKTTYQPVGENLILEVSYAHVYDTERLEAYETLTLRDAGHILRWFFESQTQAEIDPVGLRTQQLIEQNIFDPKVSAHDMDVKCRQTARMMRIDNYLPLFLFLLTRVEDVRMHYAALHVLDKHKFDRNKIQHKDIQWLSSIDYAIRIGRANPEDLYGKPHPTDVMRFVDAVIQESEASSADALKNIEKTYRFFLSEWENTSDEELGFLVELMRAAMHIRELHRMLNLLDPESVPEEERDAFIVANDSLTTLLFNISAAQLRETLKLYGEYSKKTYYAPLKKGLSSEVEVQKIEQYIAEWSEKKGLLFEVLKPLRDMIFHYDVSKATTWAKEVKDDEKDRKPHFQSFDPETFSFGTGYDYDKDLFNRYLFLGQSPKKSRILENLHNVWELQRTFLFAVKNIIEAKLAQEGIDKRPYDWHMKHFHGYHK